MSDAFRLYSGGAGGAQGASLATALPLQTSQPIYYVSSLIGSDFNTGLDRNKPYKTLAYAISEVNFVSGINTGISHIVCCMEGHREALGDVIRLTGRGTCVVGEGVGVSRPTFTPATGDWDFDLEATDILFDNLVFAPPTAAGAGAAPTVYVGNSADRSEIRNCLFQGNAYSGPLLAYVVLVPSARLTGCQFVSVATTGQPICGVQTGYAHEGEDPTINLVAEDLVFDGGSSGWSYPQAFVGVKVKTIRASGIKLLNDSDILLNSGATGYLNVSKQTGSCRVEIQ